jgi:hypothetical protein
MMRPNNPGNVMRRRSFLGRCAAILGFPLAVNPGALAKTPSVVPKACCYGPPAVAHEWEGKASDWQRAPRTPVWESSQGNEPIFIEAVHRGETLYGTYDRWGDSSVRRIRPIELFRIERFNDTWGPIYEPPVGASYLQNSTWDLGPVYLIAWDFDRCAARHFRAADFSPMLTAPWMRVYAGEVSDAEWQRMLKRTERALRRRDVQPA